MKLVVFEKNWADEFDVDGFAVLTDDEAKDHLNTIANIGEWYFGTNEGWEEGEIEEDDYKVTEITEDHAEFLIATLGKTYGNFPTKLNL